jgi:hypothetical protein
MPSIHLKQLRNLQDFVILRTSTDPSADSPVTSQLVTSALTFGATDMQAAAPNVPGRFDSGSNATALALFGASASGSIASTLGFSGGGANPNAFISWTPLSAPFNNDYGHVSAISTRSHTTGWDPLSNGATRTGACGVLAQYMYFSQEAHTTSPGTAFLGLGLTYYDPIEGRGKLFLRYGSPEWGYAGSPAYEPALILHTQDQSSVVRAETVATFEKADGRYLQPTSSPFAGPGTGVLVPDPSPASSPYVRYLQSDGQWASPVMQTREQWFERWGFQSPAATFSVPVMSTEYPITILRAYFVAYDELTSPAADMSFYIQERSPTPASSATTLSSPTPFAGATPVSPQVPYDLNVTNIDVAANMLVQFTSLPASPAVGLNNLLLHIDYVERRL